MAQGIFLKLTTMETQKYLKAHATSLRKITDNIVLDKLRVSHVDLELLDSQPSDFDIDKTITKADTQNALARLDKISQKIIYRHYWEKYKLKEVAVMLKMSYVNVRQIASRAYKELKRYLKH